MKDIKDFIYYDKTKVISIGSQLLGGMIETIQTRDGKNEQESKAREHKVGLDADVRINVNSKSSILSFITNLIDLDAGVFTEINKSIGASVLSSKDITENKVVEHYQFSILKKALIENGLLINLDQIKAHEWENRKGLKKLIQGIFLN